MVTSTLNPEGFESDNQVVSVVFEDGHAVRFAAYLYGYPEKGIRNVQLLLLAIYHGPAHPEDMNAPANQFFSADARYTVQLLAKYWRSALSYILSLHRESLKRRPIELTYGHANQLMRASEPELERLEQYL